MNLRATNQANPNQISKAMSPEQFTQIVDAILEGKYSWACVLILRFAGYNPLHYIPYRTYNRLAKENCQVNKRGEYKGNNVEKYKQSYSNGERSLQKNLGEITDLTYMEVIGEQHSKIHGRGRDQNHDFDKKFQNRKCTFLYQILPIWQR